ncbi:MAG: hypothetical protein WBW03_18395 [Silvibacterium sp.]
MKKLLKYSFLVLALGLGMITAAHAAPTSTTSTVPKPSTAPEVDPSLAMGGISLVAGTLAVLRARCHK